MKTITNTLLIAAIFTSNIVASQPCTGSQCFATFAKPVAYKVTPTFKQDSIKEPVSTIVKQPLLQEELISEVEVIQYQEPDEIIEVVNTINTESVTLPIEEPTEFLEEETERHLVVSERVDIIIPEAFSQAEENIKLSINIETICKENQELVSCDITTESTECVCV